jgi:hypothetical protein
VSLRGHAGQIEAVAERELRLSQAQIELRNETLARALVGDGLGDRIEGHQRIVRKVHLGDEAGNETGPEQGKVNVGGPPGVRMVAPWVGARLDGHETVITVLVRDRASGAGEVRVKRSWVIVLAMPVAPRSVRLPQLDERVGDRAAIFVQDAAGDDDALSDRFAGVLAREVVICFADRIVSVEGASEL